MFQGFPEIKEALIANQMQAGFMVAPMAIALRSQGVPIKIVYLGHRYGSAVVVRKDGPMRTFPDLRGRVVAIPSRFSDERLILFRAMKVHGMKPATFKMVEMAPPDVAGALAASAVDAFSMGEPFPSQAEMGGFGRVLFHAREYWPDLHVLRAGRARQDMIDKRPEAVQVLVDGIARSGLWLEQGQTVSRERGRLRRPLLLQPESGAASMGAHQAARSRRCTRPLAPRKADFDLVRDLMIETGVLDRKIEFEEYTDNQFADRATIQTAWKYEPGSQSAQ